MFEDILDNMIMNYEQDGISLEDFIHSLDNIILKNSLINQENNLIWIIICKKYLSIQ